MPVPFRFLRLLLASAAFAGLTTAAASELAPLPAEVAELVQQLRFSDAAESLAKEPETPARQLATALLMLFEQPRTRAKLETARSSLSALAQSEDHPTEVRIWAYYALGRYFHWHLQRTEATPALESYEAAYAIDPRHPIAQQAKTRALMLRIGAAINQPDQREGLLAEAENLRPSLSDPDARFAYHTVISEAYQRFQPGDPRQLPHLLALLAMDNIVSSLHADLLVRTGEIARRNGQTDLAERCYQTFLDTFPQEGRRLPVAERLEELRR
jgi:hypothetical protein